MSQSPLEITLEFARAESTGDPHVFSFTPQAYVVRTPRGGFGRSELGWNAELIAKLAAVRLAGRDPALLAEVGEILRTFLAPAGWELHEQRLSHAVQQHQHVRITIRSAAAELFALPWELLTLRATGQSLGGLPGVLIRYEWPETVTSVRKDISERTFRPLVAWSAAGGAVPAAEHIAAIRRAAAAANLRFDPASDVLPHASPARLAEALARGEREGRPVTALHLLCHGGARGSIFGVLLDGEGPEDAETLLDPARMQQLVAPHAGTLRLLVLAACDSGNQGELGGRIGSAAQMLHRAGLAAVVASRYPLSVAGSIRMTTALYDALLGERRSLEQAFLAARAALTGDVRSLDWASVQLYARAADAAETAQVSSTPSPSPAALTPGEPPASARRDAAIFGIGAVAALLVVLWWATGPASGPAWPHSQELSVAPGTSNTIEAPSEDEQPAPAPERDPPVAAPPPSALAPADPAPMLEASDTDCTVPGGCRLRWTGPKIRTLAAGFGHVCALLADGSLSCWGYNGCGQLGDGSTASRLLSLDRRVDVGGVVREVAAGAHHTCARVGDNGRVRCWGCNEDGELGQGHTRGLGDAPGEMPVDNVALGAAAEQIAAGNRFTCALVSGGSVRCWGHGYKGELGNGSAENVGDSDDEMPPTEVHGVSAAIQIVAGAAHACALLRGGAVRCWGWAASGELGNGSTVAVGNHAWDREAPLVDVGGPVEQLSAGAKHTCALLQRGRVRCWGENRYHQLGYGHADDIGDERGDMPPDDVLTGGRVLQVVGGERHTCVLLDTHRVRCWGEGEKGALGAGKQAAVGDNPFVMPPPLLDLGGEVERLEAHLGSFTCALLRDGGLRCWGSI